jgi:hypothetical protein
MNLPPPKSGMLPAPPNTCEKCAMKHDANLPHNQESLHWQYWFRGQRGRWPTWRDAMEHCSDDVKRKWVDALARLGIKVEGSDK